ncbi:MAG: DEAD/DEAH box helicase, partial [Acidobacteriota bacterium]
MPEFPALSRIGGGADAAAGLAGAVRAAFAPEGPIAAAVPGFEARPGQLRMSDAVAGVFADGGVLLAEAGTGTGKTLAYLVPAVLSRQRVLVSTGTKNLQEQIFYKDLPVLRDALGVPFSATYMKGRGNYLCLHRFDAYRDGSAVSGFGAVDAGFRRTPDETLYVRLIDEWRRETETGDRAEIEDLPEDLPFWKDISASTENCIGTECPRHHECFITRMRQRAAESDIVIVNHHLLCADAAVRQSAYGEVIPSCSYAVVDEAHQLEDVATQYFGLAVSSYRVDDLARDVERTAAAIPGGDRELIAGLRDAADRVRDRARVFFAALQVMRMQTPGLSGADNRVRVGSPHMARMAQ